MAMDTENESELGFRYWTSVRRKFLPDSPFFASGNIEREFLAKQVAFDLTENEKHELHNLEDEEGREVFCPIVGCGARLKSLEDFEDHYNARHTASCSVCSRTYPTSRLLSIHVSEAHDSFFQAKVARGYAVDFEDLYNARHTASCSVCSRTYPTSRLLSIHVSEAHDSFFQAKVARGYAVYECLVEGCDMKFKSYKNRQQHLVDKHKFPTSFEFFKKARSSKKQRHKQQHRQAVHKKQEASSAMEVEDETINGLVSAVSKLSTSDSTPSSISFGRRNPRGLTFVPRAVQREKKPDSSAS